jgi:hypothetical protein
MEVMVIMEPAVEPGPIPIRPPRQAFSVWRIVMATGFLVALLGLVFMLVDQRTLPAALCGFAMLVFLGLLTYPTRSGRE